MTTQFNSQKTILFQDIRFIQTDLIQFGTSTDFVYTQLNVKKSSILNNSVLCKYSFNVKNSSISNNSVYH